MTKIILRYITIAYCITLCLSSEVNGQSINLSTPSRYTGSYYGDSKIDSLLADTTSRTREEMKHLIDSLINSVDRATTLSPSNRTRDIEYIAAKESMKTESTSSTTMSTMGISSATSTPFVRDDISNTQLVNKSRAVGEIAISSNISQSGAKNYTVPIQCYPGRGAATPTLALSYSSQSGNGLMGRGWSISGLSAINRSNFSLFHNNKSGEFNENSSDSFILDGTRLIYSSKSGSTITFKTEVEADIKVEGYCYGNRIKYFKAWYPNGSIITYGLSSNTLSLYSYPISHFIDNNGNEMKFSYANEVSNSIYVKEFIPRLTKVEYGKRGSEANFASIVVNYKERQDVGFAYKKGKKIDTEYIIDNIQGKHNTTVVNSYTFDYNEVEGEPSTLSKIECSIYGSTLNPLKFYYGKDGSLVRFSSEYVNFGHSYSEELKYLSISKGKFEAGSDDDGLLIYKRYNPYVKVIGRSWVWGKPKQYFVNSYPDNHTVRMYTMFLGSTARSVELPVGKGFEDALVANIDGKPGDEVVQIGTYYSGENPYSLTMKVRSGDKFGNGDVISTKIFKLPAIYHRGEPSVAPKTYLTGDYNGDGKAEILAITFNNPYLDGVYGSKAYLFDLNSGSILYNNSCFDFNVDLDNQNIDNDILFPIDYNGDGKTDILHISETGLTVYSFTVNGSSYSLVKISSTTSIKLSTIKDKQLLVGDINGDGNTDLLLSPAKSYSYTNQVQVPVFTPRYCDGCGSDELLQVGWYCDNCGANVTPSDRCYECARELIYGSMSEYPNRCPEHGDYIDIEDSHYVNRGDKWKHIYSKGDGTFSIVEHEVSTCEKESQYILQDMNSDGAADLVEKSETGAIYCYPSVNSKLSSTRESRSGYSSGSGQLIPSSAAMLNYYSKLMVVSKSRLIKVSYSKDIDEATLLTASVNSYGVVDKTSYKRMNSETESIYSKADNSNKATFPYVDINGPIFLTERNKSFLNDNLIQDQSFTYKACVSHAQGLGFLGYKEMVTTDNINNISVTRDYDPYKLGVLIKESSPISETVNSYYHYFSLYTKQRKLQLTKSVSTNKLSGATTITSLQYNNDGTVRQKIVQYGLDQTEVTDITYQSVTANGKWLKRLPLQTKSTTTRGGSSAITQQNIVYNSSGLVETAIQKVNNLEVNRKQYTYNSYGLVTTEKESSYGSSRYFNKYYTYGIEDQVVNSTDPLGFTTSYNYNGRGELTRVTDFKDNNTDYTYDNLGKIVTTSEPTGNTITSSVVWSSGERGSIISAEESSTIAPTSIVYKDALGRELRSGVKGFDGTYIYTDSEYNSRGLLHQKSDPYKSGTSKRWNTTTFDTYNRVSQIVNSTGQESNYSYNGKTVTTTDQDGIASSKTVDTTGKPIQVTDEGGTISYSYRADGNIDQITAPGNITTTISYDNYGRKTALIDPSAGTTSYRYDSYGNVDRETDADGRVRNISYDSYNRIATESGTEFTTTYSYNSDGNISSVSGSNGTSEHYQYNSLLQLTQSKEIVDNRSYIENYSYIVGRISSIDYASVGYEVKYVYNNFNHLYRLNNSSNSRLWELKSINNRGQKSEVQLGNGTVAKFTYDSNGFPTNRNVKRGSSIIQNFEYSFDTYRGNLLSRRDITRNLIESFQYDDLDRLTSYGKSGSTMTTLNYADNGNIQNSTKVGSYSYALPNKPYAVTDVDNSSYDIPSVNQNISYSSFRRPTSITEGSNSLSYKYNSSFDRVKGIANIGGETTTTHYFGKGVYNHVNSSNSTKNREVLFIGGSPYSAPIVLEKKSGVISLHYLHRDYQGSITHITDSNGTLEQELSFTAWGVLRDPSNWQSYGISDAPTPLFGRGYTGHEHLNEFGLINMNARLYDPILCRFLSPDPYIQTPDFTQNFNRYSYCLNNPLIYTDPSGEIAWFVPVIIGAAIGGFSGWQIGEAAGAEGWRMAGYIGGGALIGGLSGGAAAGISAAGGGAMLAGAGGGIVGGAGFSGMATGWDGNAVLTGAVNGAIAGFIGGGVGSAIGGGWGALAGGASGNITNQLLYNDGDFSQVNWGAVGVSGAVSLGMYHGMQYMQYKSMDGKLGQMGVTYKQYAKINTAYQRSSFWKKEHGVILNRNGSARFAPRADRNKFDVTFRINPRNGDYATAHTHWARNGVDWVDIGGTGTKYQRYNAATTYPAGSARFTSVGGYHSPQDLTLPGYSLVVGRTSGTYSIGGTGYHYINPNPYLRFFLFPWNW